MSALHWSSFHNRAQHMEILIAKGAEVNLRDIDGKTALHWAAQVIIQASSTKLISQ